MRSIRRTLVCALGASGLVLGALTLSQGAAVAATDGVGSSTCAAGTLTAPTHLSGTYINLTITGSCVIQNGPVVVRGNLTVAPNASLNGSYGADHSSLTVDGNFVAQKDASVMVGCDTIIVSLWGLTALSTGPEFPCLDDPNQSAPTLSMPVLVRGNVTGIRSDGVVLHNTTVDGNVDLIGGGGGTAGQTCTPAGVFNVTFGFPPYSGIFDGKVGGNVVVTDLDTCWWGMFRTNVGGSVINTHITNDDPDGNEVNTNVIHGSLVCLNDTPAIQFGDGNGQPDKVGGAAIGQCGFGVLAPNPAPEAGVQGVTPVLQHISVPLY